MSPPTRLPFWETTRVLDLREDRLEITILSVQPAPRPTKNVMRCVSQSISPSASFCISVEFYFDAAMSATFDATDAPKPEAPETRLQLQEVFATMPSASPRCTSIEEAPAWLDEHHP
ncbi:hypothetical protein [Burkholderia ubonensis]|uniref:hypothetical protein n=1 Tax=Burkholderia ubonensis TaxID=101571 RepID=UPI0015CA67F4|nr:hypothetical protein [Burkholderia ubonensis]